MNTDKYISPLSERYAGKEMQYIFSQDMKFKTWRKLWIALAETEMELGLSRNGKPVITQEQIEERQKYLLDIIRSKGGKRIDVSWSHYETTILEAVLARGDRRVSAVIYDAWKNGCKLDGWNEYFKSDVWDQAFINIGLDKAFYANRTRSFDEISPWDHMDMLFTKDFLIEENKKAHNEKTTAHCREKCAGCGINKCLGKACFKYD